MIKEVKENIVTLKETMYQKPTELYAVVEKCIICGEKHIHGPKEGYRSGHCVDRNSIYKIVIDRENEENIRLAKKYGIQLEVKGSED